MDSLIDILMSSQQDFDALAQRIRAGIAKTGCHILTRNDLEVLWPRDIPVPDEEKRLIVNNFAVHYGFAVDLSPNLVIAAFQTPG